MPPQGHPQVNVKILDKSLTIFGLSEEDPYFRSIHLNRRAFEPHFILLAQRILSQDSVCIDIGANIGLKSLALSQICNAGQVLAIEPGKTIFNLLEANVNRSGLKNISTIHAAVTEKDGHVAFKESSAYGHIDIAGKDIVAAKCLSTIFEESKLKRLDFVKIDVEGHEFPILRSSVDFLNRFNPLILMEFNSWCQLAYGQTNPKDFLDWIFKNFRHVYKINSSTKDKVLLAPIFESDKLEFLHSNMVHNGCVDDLLLSNDIEHTRSIDEIISKKHSAFVATNKPNCTDNSLRIISICRRITAPLRKIARFIQSLKK